MHDLFISYKSDDRAWAERLVEDLKRWYPTLDIFWDRSTLRQGEDFRTQLRDGIIATRNLVALWSNKAQASQEVMYEIAAFESRTQKQIFYLPLDSTLSPMNYLQGFMSVLEARAYNAAAPDCGTSALETDPIFRRAWNRNVRQLGDAVYENGWPHQRSNRRLGRNSGLEHAYLTGESVNLLAT